MKICSLWWQCHAIHNSLLTLGIRRHANLIRVEIREMEHLCATGRLDTAIVIFCQFYESSRLGYRILTDLLLHVVHCSVPRAPPRQKVPYQILPRPHCIMWRSKRRRRRDTWSKFLFMDHSRWNHVKYTNVSTWARALTYHTHMEKERTKLTGNWHRKWTLWVGHNVIYVMIKLMSSERGKKKKEKTSRHCFVHTCIVVI